MTGKKQHPLFGTVNTDDFSPLKGMAQRQLAAFPLQETDWQQCAQEVLENLTCDIETQQGMGTKSEVLSAKIKMTGAPVAAFLCKNVKAGYCETNDHYHR